MLAESPQHRAFAGRNRTHCFDRRSKGKPNARYGDRWRYTLGRREHRNLEFEDLHIGRGARKSVDDAERAVHWRWSIADHPPLAHGLGGEEGPGGLGIRSQRAAL